VQPALLSTLVPNKSRVRIVNRFGDKTAVLTFKRFDNGRIVVHCDPGARFKRNELSFNLSTCRVEPA
jgi:hypothetical protein